MNKMRLNNEWFKNMEDRFTKITLNTILVVVVLGIMFLLYWSLWPYDIIDYKVDYFEMQKDEYRVGEPLTYRIAFCKKGSYTGTVIRTLKDGVIYIYPEITSRISEGCIDQISTTTIVPNVPTGTYVFRNEVIYKVNPIREISYIMESKPFKIIND